MEDKRQVDPEREALIQEMLRDAEGRKTELPSELDKTPVVHQGDANLPAPMVRHKISSAGYVEVWDSRTYQKARVLYYMLPQILRERRKDGSYRWTVTDPGQSPRRGTFKCLLHKDNPNREHYDSLGLRTCPKDNLANAYQVTRHMQLKHKSEWAAIEQERQDKERAEDRAFQQTMLKVQTSQLERLEPKKAKFICSKCGVDFGAEKTRDKHQETCNG